MLPGTAHFRSGDLLQRYQQDRALRFFLLHGTLQEADGAIADTVAASSALATIGTKNGAELLAHGSSFFWYHVEGLYECTTLGEEIPEQRLSLFLTQLLDSYYPLLEDGDSIAVSAVDEVVLPCLGVRFPVGGAPCTVQRLDAGRVGVAWGGEELAIEIESPGDYRLSGLQVTPGARLLLGVDSLLIDALASQELAKLSDERNQELAESLAQSLDLIRTADPSVGQQMDSQIWWYFPITTPDRGNVHNSFTIASLHGAIFLSESYGLLPLAEAMVHEYYHNELWMAMRVETHITAPRREVLYSPWREDARPLVGLYHALYVFTGLLEFFDGASRVPALRRHHEHFRVRRWKVFHQLRTGLAQVPFDEFGERGREFISALGEIIERHGKELGVAAQAVPEEQKRHWLKWTERYPELAGMATPPAGVRHLETVPKGDDT
jgi:hypothetical protein